MKVVLMVDLLDVNMAATTVEESAEKKAAMLADRMVVTMAA